MYSMKISLTAVPHIPEVQPGDDITAIIISALSAADMLLQSGDVVAVAQKIVSKAENRFVRLSSVTPGAKAREVAEFTEKDPRLVELILQESDEISRMKPGVLVTRHKLGFTSANAGIDRSNVGRHENEEMVLLLPINPDKTAAALRNAFQQELGVSVGVVITDSHGRPFRLGTVGIAIGVAGIPALWDRRGEPDRDGHILQYTDVGVADEIAAAAGLVMGQGNEGCPVVLVRGLNLPLQNGLASDLIRAKEMDLYQ
ncbi:MAG: coenzyme F420-0:L-glutamate ligase [Chloroflexi bacterium]|nr:MAG: coenzyme F420-0:L-glutamate ligase [Chloroflexota bacterium]